jgi:hypothetical protein
MDENKNNNIRKVENTFEKQIVTFLNKKGKCIYGQIFRELKIPTTRGQEAIYSLINKGVVKHIDKSSYIELTEKSK